METTVFLFVDATKVYQFKAKDSKIKDYALYWSNFLTDFTYNNKTKLGLKEAVNFFSIDLNTNYRY